MMANPHVAQRYRDNTAAGLSAQEVFMLGLHGVSVHIRRASLVANSDSDGSLKTMKCQHLANADRLLTFMIGMADNRTPMGTVLIRCYTGIQQLICAALNDTTDPSSAAPIDDALSQATELEKHIKLSIEWIDHGQPA